MRLSPLNITTEGSGLAWDFSFNLFGLLMIGYQIPICLSCSLLPAVAWRTVFGEHLEAGCWIGSILAGPCAPASALGAWRLGHGPEKRQSCLWGWGVEWGERNPARTQQLTLAVNFLSVHYLHQCTVTLLNVGATAFHFPNPSLSSISCPLSFI